LETEFFQEYAKTMIPLSRYGKEGELDTAAIFLASPLSTYVNGVILPVDGGYTSL
jgi:gluconate 5-dehydrogenase